MTLKMKIKNPWETDDLSDYLDNCQESVPVYVKYPKKW